MGQVSLQEAVARLKLSMEKTPRKRAAAPKPAKSVKKIQLKGYTKPRPSIG